MRRYDLLSLEQDDRDLAKMLAFSVQVGSDSMSRPHAGVSRGFRRVLAWCAVGVALGLPCGASARAQWGMGYGGFGMGMGGQIGNMAIMNNINDRSAAAANAAYAARQTMPGVGRVYGNNPNAYINNTRDASFTERFDVSTRRSLGQQMARLPETRTAVAATGTQAGSATVRRTVLPLASFFSAAGELIWPSEAPEEGPLGSQKVVANSAANSVFRDFKANGTAPVALVSDARNQLIAYGQPALTYLREHTTPAVVDTFHRFLLGLYDSLGKAALAAPSGG